MNMSNNRFNPLGVARNWKPTSGLVLGMIIMTALLAFEMFNYSTTDFALRDLLGDLKFAGIRWATILAIAFCGIDFAGIARLFTPEQGNDEPKEVWYLFGAWLLAATMNAVLTWWGVSMAILTHNVQSTAVLPSETITKVVPAFVAIMVWVIRILIIGTLSVAGDKFLWGSKRRANTVQRSDNRPSPAPSIGTPAAPMPRPSYSAAPRPAPRPTSQAVEAISVPRPEPTYHSVSMNARNATQDQNTRRM